MCPTCTQKNIRSHCTKNDRSHLVCLEYNCSLYQKIKEYNCSIKMKLREKKVID
jgi:hypothetical protein